jgi:hypothetical protein
MMGRLASPLKINILFTISLPSSLTFDPAKIIIVMNGKTDDAGIYLWK